MKTTLNLIRRKMQLHLPQLIGLMLLIAVGTCFFMVLFTIVTRYEESAEEYFSDLSYADVTFYGVFGDESVEKLSDINGVLSAQGRTVRDFRDDERIIRVISLTDGINMPYLYDGRLPENKAECIILERNASAMDLYIGDSVVAGDTFLTITGLAASPEYIYLTQNERTRMANPASFVVMYVTKGFYAEGHNEIVITTKDDFSINAASEILGAFRSINLKNQINYELYKADLDEISSFSFIFPLVFAILISVVIYVMLSRTVQKDRRQIGTMKALGASDGKIIGIYLIQFCVAAFIGGFIGCLAAIFITDIIVGIFANMFVVPTLGFAFYPGVWLLSILVSVLLCAISGLIALVSILPLLPAHAMRPRVPKGGRRTVIERIGFIWKRLTFNTRYALKNSLRNKTRFFAVVLGMCGSCALLAFSMGFYDSIGNTQNKYFNDFANYDVIMDFDPIPFIFEHPAAEQMDEYYKALLLHVDIHDESYMLAIVEDGFDMVNIPVKELRNGVIIPEYFSEQWGVKAGDVLEISGYAVPVSAVIPQYLGLTLYTSYDFLNQITNEIPTAYNSIYGRSDDLAGITAYFRESNINYSTINDDKTSFEAIMGSMSILIWFMIACAVVLGVTVLYSVGLINLSAREYEYMFMGVMGYPHKSIMTAHFKETIMQLILAIPLGFLSANVLLGLIKGEFSSNNFVISASIYPQSYFIAAASVVIITALMAGVTSRHINKLDIVEGLKTQDE